MAVNLAEILKLDVFESADVICGNLGLDKPVKRISVFDCAFHEEIVSDGLLIEGDLLLTTLEQFDSAEGLMEFLTGLYKYGTTALVVLYTGNLKVVTAEVHRWCNEHDFPIIIQRKTILYIEIMASVNQFLSADEFNDINLLRLDKLRYAVLSDSEKNTVIRAINPDFRNMIRVICIRNRNQIVQQRIKSLREHILCSYDSVISGDYLILILSDSDEKNLRYHTDAVTSQLRGNSSGDKLGFGRIYPRLQLDKSLDEAMKAVHIADALNIKQADYDPLLTLPILLAQGNSVEERDFYKAYVDRIRECVSEEMLPSILNTIECFVSCKGDYTATAEKLHQHANTIRYRVNKVRSSLGMDDNPIRFYETIALATKIRILFGYKIE